MKKIKIRSIPKIKKNKDFKSIIVRVIFPLQETVNDLAKIQLLPSMLRRMTNKYPSEEEFQTARKKLYILDCSCSSGVVGTTGYFAFDLVIPDVKSLEKNILDEQFSFFKEFIYYPKKENNGFDTKNLKRGVENIRLGMSNAFKNLRSYHIIKLKQLVDDGDIFSRDLIHHQALLDDVTSENLYDFYVKNIVNNKPAIYVMGDVDEVEINNLCNKHLYKKQFTDYQIDGNFNYYFTPRNKVLEVEEDSEFKDSVYSLVYKVKEMKEKDVPILNALCDLLVSASSRLLSEKLRDENDLIYSSRIFSYPHFGVFEITVFINKDNVEQVKEKLEELVKEFKNINVINKSLENIKERRRLDQIRQLDDKYFLFDDFLFSDLGIDLSYKEYFDLYSKISAEDISNFTDRLVLDTCYFLKEGDSFE